MAIERFLTGITPSGSPHLGNFVGSIRPSVAASRRSEVESFYFLADYHALIKIDQPERIARSTLEIAASWLACGLDPHKVVFYRQSDIPEIPELSWFLGCVLGKGALNRAHAYKAALDKNLAAKQDPDSDVSVGLFLYPVLMGADILLFNAHQVPVGRDQVQHVEMARAMANSFNHRYGAHFVAPEAAIDAHVATLPGLDGRKMSKSYDNTIPLFAPRAQLQKLINSIVTDSLPPGAPKNPQNSALFQIYQAFASADETENLRQAFAQGIAWQQVKQQVFERIEQDLAPLRANYERLLANPAQIEAILQLGAAKARASASPFMAQLRHAVGLRDLRNLAPPKQTSAKDQTSTAPVFKQYRAEDGLFYFKLHSASGQLLLQSQGFNSPQALGQSIAKLQTQGAAALAELAGQITLTKGVSQAQLTDALLAWQQAKAKTK